MWARAGSSHEGQKAVALEDEGVGKVSRKRPDMEQCLRGLNGKRHDVEQCLRCQMSG